MKNFSSLRILALSGALALGALLAGGANAMPAAPLAAGAASDVQQVWHDGYPHRRYHRRPRVTVYPDYYFDDYSYYYPAVRGFEDRNPVPRGNIRGCSVDLGYGRYESCDK